MNHPTISLELNRIDNGVWQKDLGRTPTEIPVLLTVNGNPWVEFMCTPEHLDALAVGFLFNEGLIDCAKDIAQSRVCPKGDNVDVWTSHPIEKPSHWRMTSGCAGGITSVGMEAGLPEKELPAPPRGFLCQFEELTLNPSMINGLILDLYRVQELHRQSGGVHASALSDGRHLFLSCEDIGRHNTLDKLAGRVLLENIVEPRRIILTTGRISSEMLQKSASLGVSVVISFTSPTSLAVQLADQWGMTLIGYAQNKHFKIYSHPERIEA